MKTKISYAIPLELLLVLIFTALLLFFTTNLEKTSKKEGSTTHPDYEMLYVPNSSAVKALAFGYHNVAADLLWFKTISYFGKHYKLDRDYRWLAKMCGVVTDLDQNFHPAFQFCSTMLSWEVSSPADSITLLSKAIEVHPNNWKYRYLRGFTYMFFLKENEKAQADLVAASKLQGAPSTVVRLAAKKLAQESDPNAAIEFLVQMLKMEKDPTARKALEDRLLEIKKGQLK